MYKDSRPALKRFFDHATGTMTARQILAGWPGDFPKPCDLALRHRLQRDLESKRIERDRGCTRILRIAIRSKHGRRIRLGRMN